MRTSRAAITAAFLALASTGCSVHRTPPSLAAEATEANGGALPPPAPFVAHPLRTHADYDAVEAAFRKLGALGTLVSLYRALLDKRPTDALLRVRTIALVVEAGGRRRISQAIDLIGPLSDRVGKDPDATFAAGAIKRAVVRDAVSGTLFVPRGHLEIAERLVAEWRTIARQFPDWVGPRGVRPTELAREADALDRAIDAARKAASAARGGTSSDGLETDRTRVEAWLAELDFYRAAEQAPPADACRSGRKALEAHAAEASSALRQRVAALCRLAGLAEEDAPAVAP